MACRLAESDAVPTAGAGSRVSLRTSWPWLAGTAAALGVVGPALRPGNVFLLDASFLGHLPLPAGIWGLGPELPRRVPLGAAVSLASDVLGGSGTGAVLIGASVAVACAGAARLAAGTPWAARLGAGLLYGLSPFILTRAGAGQWNVLAAAAVLPWAMPSLLAPGRRPAATLVWAAAMGATGSVGGSLAALAVLVGVLAERSRAALAAAGLAAIVQLPWLVPGIVVVSQGGLRLAGSAQFPTRAPGLAGALGLLAGGGFWRPASQVGVGGAGAAVLGSALGALALLGAPSLPRLWRWRALALAGVGIALTLASALPGLRDVYGHLTSNVVGGSFRESQRALALALAWLAPSAAWGAARLAGPPGRLAPALARGTPAAVAAALALPGLFGLGGRLSPVALPEGWNRARAEVQQHPGPVLALPFERHLPLAVARGRDVLDPLPDLFGGDVVSSPVLGSARTVELAEPRLASLLTVLARARGAEPVAGQLASLGIRWVALLRSAGWRSYQGLRSDPGLAEVVGSPSLQLFEVRSWVGPVRDLRGRRVPLTTVVPPLRLLASGGAAVFEAPGYAGWMRGLQAAGRTRAGLVGLPAGQGPLWYWPATAVLASDLAAAIGLGAAWRALRREPLRQAGEEAA